METVDKNKLKEEQIAALKVAILIMQERATHPKNQVSADNIIVQQAIDAINEILNGID